MKNITDQLAFYGSYHLDKRNVATHFVGVPMIAFSVLIGGEMLTLGTLSGVPVTLALLIYLMGVVFYFYLDLTFGVLMAVIFGAALAAATPFAAGSYGPAWQWGIGLFVVGWIIQAIGHMFEGRKPAFFDDVVGLLVGPLFLVAEVVFVLGLRRDLAVAVKSGAKIFRAAEDAA